MTKHLLDNVIGACDQRGCISRAELAAASARGQSWIENRARVDSTVVAWLHCCGGSPVRYDWEPQCLRGRYRTKPEYPRGVRICIGVSGPVWPMRCWSRYRFC